VARTPRLSPRFLAQRGVLGITQRSASSRALAAAIADACSAEALPAPGDLTTLLDPDVRGVSLLVHVRRVPGHNLWVWYRDTGGFLDLVDLIDHPPA
jgi:hypothetical protein